MNYGGLHAQEHRARGAPCSRCFASLYYSVLRVVDLVIDIVNKAANYHDRELQT